MSTKAASCPSCGASQKKQYGCFHAIGLLFLIFFGLAILGSLVETESPPSYPAVSPDFKKKAPVIAQERGEKNTPQKTEAGSVAGQGPTGKSVESPTYKEKETVAIGYTSYAVWDSWWSDYLVKDNTFLDQAPDAKYLFVEVSVRNDDKKPRMIPPFKLVDENGAQHQTTSKAWAVSDALGPLDSLNPGVIKEGVIVFDVPRGHTYKLLVEGGFWSAEKAYIDLDPE